MTSQYFIPTTTQAASTNSNSYTTYSNHDLDLQTDTTSSASLSEKLLFHDHHHSNIDTTAAVPPNTNNDGRNYYQQPQLQQDNNGSSSLFLPIHDTTSTTNSPNTIGGGGGSGSEQHKLLGSNSGSDHLYRDIWATILFCICQCIVLYMSVIRLVMGIFHRSSDTNSNNDDGSLIQSFYGLIYMILLSTGMAILVSCCMMGLLMKHVNSFIHITIGIVILGNIMVVLFCITNGLWFGCIGAIIFLIFAIVRGQSYQRRIPFAVANIRIACTAISTNYGLLLVAVGISIFNFIYSILCIVALITSSSIASIDRPGSGNDDDGSTVSTVAVFFLLIMYYWTSEVGKNIIHVTTSGVMGTFWFAPHDASTFWSPAIYDSFYRSITYSFGSICFGSLVTTFLFIVHYWVREIRSMQRRTTFGPSVVLCALECISGFLERLVLYFNKWAYVYVGLYGYDYVTAGSKVMTLFTERGWTAIINDQLVSSVLTLVSVIIGIGAGCFGVLLSMLHQSWVQGFGDGAVYISFVIPTLVGMFMAIILTSVIRAAVDTVIVAFAEAPAELEQNHPGLSAQLVTAWQHVFPDEFGR